MSANSISHIHSTFEAMRDAFRGIALRHDHFRCRWVIAEEEYGNRLGGPSGHSWDNLIGAAPFILREPDMVFVTPEQHQEIAKERPEATFACNSAGESVYYRIPAIRSVMHHVGDIGAFREFELLARDAGHCLVLFLNQRKMNLRLPDLVPYESIAGVNKRSLSTQMPNDLQSRWYAFLHVLGWQNLPFSPLRAERKVWDDSASYIGDPDELRRLLAEAHSPEIAERIPLPTRYFASTLLSDVSLSSVYAIDAILTGMLDFPPIDVEHFRASLAAIRPGKAGANKFHLLVKEMLALIFDPDLHSPESEEKIHEGRGRIDVTFSNAAERGYFADLTFRHRIICPVVFFECKNYSSDVGPKEFSQLISRFSDKRTKAGFIVCRKIRNAKRVRQACRDRFQDNHEQVLVLDDADLLAMLEHKANRDVASISKHLHTKFRPIFMDT